MTSHNIKTTDANVQAALLEKTSQQQKKSFKPTNQHWD